MLEEYLKRLENMIVPNYYDKNNFKNKIKAELEDPSDAEEKKKKISITNEELLNKIQNEDDKKLLEEYIQKMGLSSPAEESKNISNENRLKIYQKILENEGGSETALDDDQIRSNFQGTKSQKTLSVSPSKKMRISSSALDEDSLRQKVHVLNIKNMNYRYEVETLKNKIEELTKKLEEQQIEIEKFEKQKESSSRYLIKLESMVNGGVDKGSALNSSSMKSQNSSKIISSNVLSPSSKQKSQNFSGDFSKYKKFSLEDRINNTMINFGDKNDLNEYVNSLKAENLKLKQFQSRVFEISKNYDALNEKMLDSMKHVQNVLNTTDREEMSSNLQKVIENVEMSLEMKQNEFGFLIESKDQQINFLQDETLRLKDNLENLRRDRLRDQKLITDFESEISFLSSRVQDGQSKQIERSNNELTQSLKLEKKIAPVKSTVNRIVKKFERTFDLQDKTNVKMISNITKNIK